MKICTYCNINKNLQEYYLDSIKNIRYSRCKSCCSIVSKKRKEDPLKAEHDLIKSRKYYNNNKEFCRKLTRLAKIKKKFNLTENEYNKMFIDRNNKCDICKQEETTRKNGKDQKLAVDHCHKTGKVRGLLCRLCNSAIGQLKESPELFESAINYLRMHNG